jgi:hypothetical protein
MNVEELDDVELLDVLREHLAGDDRLEALVDELVVRYLERAVFAYQSVERLNDLLQDAIAVAHLAPVADPDGTHPHPA